MTSIDRRFNVNVKGNVLDATLTWMFWPVMVGLGGYGAVVGTMYSLQRSLMYYPYPVMSSPADAGVPEMEEVRISSTDGLILKSWYAPPARDGAPTVVFLHGNAGNIAVRADKARLLLDHGYGVMLVGYRGYGDNPGTPTEQGLHDDAAASLKHLVDAGVPLRRMVIYGESLGSGVAVNLAADHHPGAVVLEAPFTSTIDVANQTYWYLPVRQLMKDRFESVARIRDIGAPVLMMHGRKDGVVPFPIGRRLFDAALEPKEFVEFPKGMHADLYENGAVTHVFDFIDRRLGSGVPAVENTAPAL